MRLYVITDLHFGKWSNDSERWLKNMTSYFYNFLIPLLKEYAKPNDKLMILGDIFDNRNNLNLKVVYAVVKLFEDLSKVIEIHTILGNHDMSAMSDPEINSVCTIRNISNVHVYEQPKVLTWLDKDIVMMPWVHGKESEKQVLEKYSGADMLLCHSDLNGCRTQLYPTRPISRHILDIDDFNGYKRVLSGHIHIHQTINNFTFVGSPYHLDRNDVGNQKGVLVYDLKKDKETFIPNDYSPEFVKIQINEEDDLDTLREQVKTNNIIDLEISNTLVLNSPKIRLEIDKICNKHVIEAVDWIDDVVKDKKVLVQRQNFQDKTPKEISHDWIDRLKYNDDLELFTEIEFKNKLKETVDKCFRTLEEAKK